MLAKSSDFGENVQRGNGGGGSERWRLHGVPSRRGGGRGTATTAGTVGARLRDETREENMGNKFVIAADVGILCAAVADFRPETVAGKKIKREKEEELTLHLQATQDIAASLGKIKEDNQLLVGFALETNNEQQNAEGKLERKNFDFIVLNSLNDAGAGFRHDTNKISIIDRKGREDYPLKPKQEVAQDIIDHLVAVLTH